MSEKSEKLLILDLDETLIYSTENRLDTAEDFQLDKYFVYKRPYLDQFLIDVSKHFVIGIWSSADDIYVTEIINRIMPHSIVPELVWGRSRCSLRRDLTFDTHYFEKRLDKLKKRGFKLDHILIVDDTPEKARTNYGNAIHIKEFIGNSEDKELLHLYTYLLKLKDLENIRTLEKTWLAKLRRVTHNIRLTYCVSTY